MNAVKAAQMQSNFQWLGHISSSFVVKYLECDGPLSWEVWEDRLPSNEFPWWQPEMVALGEMESDCNASLTT